MCMKMRLRRRISRFLTISSVVLSFALNAQTQETPGVVVDKIIVKVDNYIVLKSELESSYQNYITGGNQPSEEARCGILKSLVINKLMVAKAEIDSVIVTDVEVDANTQQRMAVI